MSGGPSLRVAPDVSDAEVSQHPAEGCWEHRNCVFPQGSGLPSPPEAIRLPVIPLIPYIAH